MSHPPAPALSVPAAPTRPEPHRWIAPLVVLPVSAAKPFHDVSFYSKGLAVFLSRFAPGANARSNKDGAA